uniref:Nucleoporin FG repeat region containing protein, putative n=1 Tax=Theileria annulata TaxID=5874 RepID=A0A3B0MP97_THEAN
MSSLFNQNQNPQVNTGGGFLGSTYNFLNNPGTGLNNPPGYQNVGLGNFPQQQVLDSRSSVRQLTTLIPEWKGHFDLADVLMTSQEQHLNNVSMMVSQLYELYSKFQTTFDYVKTSLNDINLQQDKLNEDLNERLKCQDLQNLVTIKSRRLCENVINKRGTNDMSSVFRIPNHINVQLSRELYERVRQFRSEVEYIQNEVQLLKEIDVFQAPNFIESVLNSHKVRIKTLGDMLSNHLKRAEKSLNKDLKSHLWSGISYEPSVLRSDFLNAIGLDKPKPPEPDTSQNSEVKKQIRYLRNFNSSYNDPNFPYLKDYGYNIKDLLTNFVPNQNVSLQGVSMATPNTSSLFGTSQFGASNLTTPFGTTTGTSQPGGLFGSSQPVTTQPTGLFGNTGSGLFGASTGLGATTGLGSTSATTGTGLFGSTTDPGSTTGITGSGLFGSTTNQTATTQPGGLFGSNTGTTTGTGLFGSTTGLGTTTGTTTGSGLFGSTSGTTGTGFGNTGSSGTGLFGSNTSTTGTSQPGGLFGTTQTGTTGTGLFGSTTGNTGSGLFGNTTGLGSTTGTTTGSGLFGSTNTSSAFGTTGTTGTGLFGSTNTTTGSAFGNTNTGTFGATNTGAGFSSSTTSGLFGNTSTSSGFGTNTGTSFGTGGSSLFGSNQQKSTGTALAIYNPNPNTGLGSFNRT